MSNEVLVEYEGKVMVVTLNRPPANAFTTPFSTELFGIFKAYNENEDLRCAIITAAPNEKNIFSAGWDLKAVARGEGRDSEKGWDLGPGGLGGITEFFELYKPVIAAVNGAAVGGGFEVALASDIVVASENAYFSLPEMQRGFLPDSGAIQRLHHKVPYNVAIDLMLTGRRLSASEAKHWGLVRDVLPRERLLEHALEIAQQIAKGAPMVAPALKEYLRATAHLASEEAHAVSRKAWVGKSNIVNYERMMGSKDFNEGAKAFSEKRSATFEGR